MLEQVLFQKTDWHSNYDALQLNTGGALASYASGTVFGTALSTNQRTTGDTFVNGNKYIASKAAQLYLQDNSGNHIWYNAASGTADATISWNERMRIDSSGNLLVGKTAVDTSVAGTVISSGKYIFQTRDSAAPLLLRRNTTDGNIAEFYKDGTTVGGIGANGGYPYFANTTRGIKMVGSALFPSYGSGTTAPDLVDIGGNSSKFKRPLPVRQCLRQCFNTRWRQQYLCSIPT